MKLFLFDAYALIYRSYYAFINNPRINSKGMNTSAVLGFMNTLHEIISKENPTHLGVAFDHGKTFRDEAYPQYKAQRESTPEDIRKSVPIIKELLNALHIPVLQVDGFEADDVIGTLATRAGEQGIETYMLTPDKDYGQLVTDSVFQYRPRHGGGYETLGPTEVSAKYGIASPTLVIDLLALMGDSADNFPGCPGVGEKTAVKLINEFGTVEELLKHTNKIKGKLRDKVEAAVDDIKMSKFLATIRTDVPIALDLEDLKRKPANEAELQRLLAELEMKSIAKKFLSDEPKAEIPVKKGLIQLDLFAENPVPTESSCEISQGFSLKIVKEKTQVVLCLDVLREKSEKILTKENLILEIETDGKPTIDASVTKIALATDENDCIVVTLPVSSTEREEWVSVLRPILKNKKSVKIGYNLKSVILALRKDGIELGGELSDLMVAHYLLHPEQNHSLENIAGETLEDVGERACSITLLHPNFIKRLKDMNQYQLFREIEMPLIRVLSDMEQTGVRLNAASLAETARELNTRLAVLEKEIYALAGEEFNIASPRQVGQMLFGKMQIVEKAKKTRGGHYVTNEEVLQQLKGKSPIVGKILEHRSIKKLMGTYINTLPTLVNPRTGHIHTSFNQCVAVTGRLSSSDPNLQNIPIRGEDGKEIRKAFVPEPGQLWFSADYSQIELRVMAHLSQDPTMLDAFIHGRDVHAATASRIYHKAIEEITREERTKSKRANFGIIYGITIFGLAERLDIDRTEAKQLIDGFFQTFPQVQNYMEKAIERARVNGFAETFMHRRRYLPDIHSSNSTVRGFAERNAINAPIQGSAADIIKVAMVRIHRRFQEEKLQSRMILQVHDELNFSVLPEERDRVEQIVMQEMQAAYALSVPLTADCGWGGNWLEAH